MILPMGGLPIITQLQIQMPRPSVGNSLTIIKVSSFTIPPFDGRTDGQTELVKQYRVPLYADA